MNDSLHYVPPLLRLMVVVGARNHGISVGELRGAGVTRKLSRTRWRIAKAARIAGFSLPTIGRALNKDHTSVLHGLRRLEEEEGRT